MDNEHEFVIVDDLLRREKKAHQAIGNNAIRCAGMYGYTSTQAARYRLAWKHRSKYLYHLVARWNKLWRIKMDAMIHAD